MKRLFTVTLLAVLAACGSSGGSAEADAYVDALTAEFLSGDTTPGLGEDEARCLAEDMVDVIGVDRFRDAGIRPRDVKDNEDVMEDLGKDLSRAEADEVVSVMFDGECFDLGQVMAREAIKEDPDSGTSVEQMECVFEKMIGLPAFRRAMADSILGKASTEDALDESLGGSSEIFSIMGECGISVSDLGG